MEKSKKKILILAITGGLAGLLICFIMSMLSSGSGEEVNIAKDIFYYIISFLHGAICMGTVVVYEIERWSIARCTITHFVITLSSFYLLGFFQEWLEFGSLSFWIITACFVVAYFIIWLINYIRFKRMIKVMNKDLAKIKKSE